MDQTHPYDTPLYLHLYHRTHPGIHLYTYRTDQTHPSDNRLCFHMDLVCKIPHENHMCHLQIAINNCMLIKEIYIFFDHYRQSGIEHQLILFFSDHIYLSTMIYKCRQIHCVFQYIVQSSYTDHWHMYQARKNHLGNNEEKSYLVLDTDTNSQTG